MKALVIAAGEGTRLWPLTTVLPKAFLPVGGRPVSRYIVERLARQGFKEIVFCINKHFETQFKDYFEDGSRFGVNIEYSSSEVPMGTAGEIVNAKKFIDGPFIMHYGDELTFVNLRELADMHLKRKAIATLALVTGIPIEVGVVALNSDDTVKGFIEKPPLDKYTWAGIAAMDEEILNFMKKDEDLASVVFPRLIKSGKKILAYKSDARWLDIGSISHWKIADKLAAEGSLK